ncbi:hypothetical protein CNX70_25475 [Janthinobacterium svalbardensis]|uniref:Uncharacterized protein n=1 Tax=Janthinobacterium svalbardensis TaxID=368607 RepID=A0A290X1Z9_9BURK|nr:hypothetical protein CNX70_25475 [Janthinobacterium svalbardensis]
MLSHNRAANAAASVSGNDFLGLPCGPSRQAKILAQASSQRCMKHAFFPPPRTRKKSAVTMTALLGVA